MPDSERIGRNLNRIDMEPIEKPAAEEIQKPDATPELAAQNDAVVTTTEPENADSSEEQTEKQAEEQRPTARFNSMTKEQLVEALAATVERPVEEAKDDVAAIKHAFYSIRKEELEKEKAAFVEKGNEESAFAPMNDEAENSVKELLNKYKEARTAYQEAIEAALQSNLEKKQAIIAELTEIVKDPDNINKQYQRFQQLQQDFKAAGDVPPAADKGLWKDFQSVTEEFYDLWKINRELRDYDFKKNMEAKIALCEEAEALDGEKDVLTAFKKLQELHDKWREVGPVMKEQREDLWKRFKEASTVINKKHQAFFEGRKEQEKENEMAKTALCEEIEAIDIASINSYAKWDAATEQIKNLQERWKSLGFASKKVNNELYARFRKSCDEFFAQKAVFFKKMKEESAAILSKKRELCEKAEALKESTDWKKTGELLTELQKEWKKTGGPIPRRTSEALWKRFIGACDYFFENRNKNSSNSRQAELDNLKSKKEVVEKLKNIDETLPKEEIRQLLKDLSAEYQNIGHVPFKEKDKVYEEYKSALNAAYDKFDLNDMRRRGEDFASDLEELSADKNKLYKEREKLARMYEQKKNEVKTYENNLGFFNVTSKAGGSLQKEMERRMAKAKEELAALEKKIELLDEKI